MDEFFLFWLGWQDSNLRMQQSKCCVLPLDDTPILSFKILPRGRVRCALDFFDRSERLRKNLRAADFVDWKACRGVPTTSTNLRMQQSKCCVLPLDDTPILNLDKGFGRRLAKAFFVWGGRWDSNPRSPVPQTGALTN